MLPLLTVAIVITAVAKNALEGRAQCCQCDFLANERLLQVVRPDSIKIYVRTAVLVMPVVVVR